MNKSKVWFVTGASQGLGLTLVKLLLAKGYRVASTSRTVDKLKEAVGRNNVNFLPLAVDLNNESSVEKAIRQTIEEFGTIDVIVNNAGYGMIGTAEGTSNLDIRKIFEVNVFASILVTKGVLPIMRKQGSGHIFNIGSVAGFAGAAGWSVYAATKAAIAAFSEVLAIEVKEFGIKVTVVEPSGFRTGFLTKDSLTDIDAKRDEYPSVVTTRKSYLAANGIQAGDPEKAASILIELFEMGNAPLHLYLGKDAYNRVSTKLSSMTTELEQWKNATTSADY